MKHASLVGRYISALNKLLLRDAEAADRKWGRYFDPVPELSVDFPLPILGVMILIWQLRDQDLQARYSLDTYESKLEFIAWCVFHGRREYKALLEADQLWQALDQRVACNEVLTSDGMDFSISWLIMLVGRERTDLGFDLESKRGHAHLLAWYLVHGRRELDLVHQPLPAWLRTDLLRPSPVTGLSRLQYLIYETREDVKAAFPLPYAQNEFLKWFDGLAEQTGLGDALVGSSSVADSVQGWNSSPKTPGVNIYGYVYGELGIGEDARMAARSLLSAGVPVCLQDFSPGKKIPQNDVSMRAWVKPTACHDINLICLPALEHGRLFAERGKSLFDCNYSIGYWPWELSSWPEEWMHLCALVDEVWLSSEHTFRALNYSASVPVRHMPMAVEMPPSTALKRSDFGLPEKSYLFLFAFDLNSTATRKNPAACINAFLAAFPSVDTLGRQVGLVIKVHPPVQPNSDWEKLKKLRLNDPRIYLIEKTLNKEDLTALYRACDCFLSLHRAEGFGRIIAESMLLGKPVIVTGYSGNLDFTWPDNSFLVPYSELPIEGDAYPYGAGKRWAEPNIGVAAKHMQTVAQDPVIGWRTGMKGRATIQQRHNMQVIGQRYREVLQIKLSM